MAKAALAGLLACLLVVAGCAGLADLGEIREELDRAGYDATSLNHNTTNGHSVLTLDVSTSVGTPTEEDAEKVAEVVWTRTATDFDELVVATGGRVLLDTTADALQDRLGDRPPRDSEKDEGGSSSAVIVIVVLAVAAVFAGLMVLLWYRGRKSLRR